MEELKTKRPVKQKRQLIQTSKHPLIKCHVTDRRMRSLQMESGGQVGKMVSREGAESRV